MKKLAVCGALVGALGLASCESTTQVLNQEQVAAIQVAVNRGQFEMSCPSATGVVLSRNLIQPVLNGPLVSGPQRAEYAIGVSGCGKKGTYIALCQVGSTSCVSGESRPVQ